jgi:uncharacterized protein (TIGR01370 family)
MLLRIVLGVSMCGLLTQCNSSSKMAFNIKDFTPFGVCYSKITPHQLQNYEMVIVEPDFYTQEEMQALRATGTKVIAYISLGEVDTNRWYFPLMEAEGFLGKNENWNSYFLDLKAKKVREIITTQVVPEIMAKGADGLFFDTVDAVSPETPRSYLQPYMANLIQRIRVQYPDKTIIQNAGLFLLNDTKENIDAFLTETLASNYSFTEQEYQIRNQEEFNDRLNWLEEYSSETGKPFFIIDFANTNYQRQKIKSRLDTLRKPYFISNIGLSELPLSSDSVANDLRNWEL